MKPPLTVVAAVLLALIASPSAQQAPTGPTAVMGVAPVRLPDEPMAIDTAEQHKIRVVVLAKGFLHPSSLAFIPDGGMLVTERAGRLRIVRGHVLDPEPIDGVPPVHVAQIWGLMDIALHPQFEATRLLYLTYIKPLDEGRFTIAMAPEDGSTAMPWWRCATSSRQCRRPVALRGLRSAQTVCCT